MASFGFSRSKHNVIPEAVSPVSKCPPSDSENIYSAHYEWCKEGVHGSSADWVSSEALTPSIISSKGRGQYTHGFKQGEVRDAFRDIRDEIIGEVMTEGLDEFQRRDETSQKLTKSMRACGKISFSLDPITENKCELERGEAAFKMSSSGLSPPFEKQLSSQAIRQSILESRSVKKRATGHHKEVGAKASEANGCLWTSKYAPNNLQELAVHKKKVEQVSQILVSMLIACRRRRQTTISHVDSTQEAKCLIITGPCGAGKTQTIRLLVEKNLINNQTTTGIEKCRTFFQCRLMEYHSPVEISINSVGEAYNQDVKATQKSKLEPFFQFLTRSKYPSLPVRFDLPSSSDDGLDSEKSDLHTCVDKVLLVENMPYLHDSNQTRRFQDFILFYLSKSVHYPIVFIISDDRNFKGPSQLRRIFSDHILEHQAVKVVEFNQVSLTTTQKILTKICKAEGLAFTKEYLLSISEMCQGDIRNAILTLQFVSRKTVLKSISLPPPSKKKRQLNQPEPESLIYRDANENPAAQLYHFIGKDPTLALFHCVGKIMYKKRLKNEEISDARIPARELSQHPVIPATSPLYRLPLKASPEAIQDMYKDFRESETFVQFLYENYARFDQNLESVCLASDYLSISDILSKTYADKASLQEYSGLIAMRGILFSHSVPIQKNYQAFVKPQCFGASQKIKENTQLISRAYWSRLGRPFGYAFSREQLCGFPSKKALFTELVPFQGAMFKAKFGSAEAKKSWARADYLLIEEMCCYSVPSPRQALFRSAHQEREDISRPRQILENTPCTSDSLWKIEQSDGKELDEIEDV